MPSYGELIILASPRGKRHIYRLSPDQDIHTQDGVLLASKLVQSQFGCEVLTEKGIPFRLQRPELYDIIMGAKRQTQIMYPKDMGLICFKLGVGHGRTILEAGSGSGGFTIALSWFTGLNGHIHSFEAREEFYKLAQKNVEWAGLGENVSFHLRDISLGFGLEDPKILNNVPADALFLDVRTPWEYLDLAIKALVPGAPIAFLLPTVEQVSELIRHLELKSFEETEVCEILVRPWKPVPGRLRPADRMSAHTAFLVFTRIQERSSLWDASIPLGTRERKQEAARQSRLAEYAGMSADESEYEV